MEYNMENFDEYVEAVVESLKIVLEQNDASHMLENHEQVAQVKHAMLCHKKCRIKDIEENGIGEEGEDETFQIDDIQGNVTLECAVCGEIIIDFKE